MTNKTRKVDIDVIIPVYNGESYVKEAIQSAIGQTLKPRSVIVVDDGSIDQTAAIVKNVKGEGVKVKYFHKKNGGPSSARNYGLKFTNSEYVAFLDADDKWRKNKLEKQLSKFKTSDIKNLGVVYCGYSWIDFTGKTLNLKTSFKLDTNIRGNVHPYLIDGNKISGSDSAVLIKRKCFKSVGIFDEKLGSCEDWDMWLRISRKYGFDYVNEDLVQLRRHDASRQNNKKVMFMGHVTFFGKLMDSNEVSSKSIKFFRYQLLRELVKQFPHIDAYKQLNKNLSESAKIRLFGDKVYILRCLFNIVVIDNILQRFISFIKKKFKIYART